MMKMMLKTIGILLTVTFGFSFSKSYAQGLPGQGGLYASFSMMYLASSTTQGGKGSDGSTFLTETEIVNKTSWFNYGGFLQYDSQGSSQNDLEIGYKVEYEFLPFYVEAGSSLYVKRTFTDRSIASQEGTGYRFGLGVRVPLQSMAGFWMQFSYKQRTQQIETQDGKPLDEKITQTDTYPVFGVGYTL